MEQARRDEEWALIRVGGWAVLLVFIVAVLLVSPWPWGAWVGLAFWVLGARGVLRAFSAAVARTKELEGRIESHADAGESGDDPGLS